MWEHKSADAGRKGPLQVEPVCLLLIYWSRIPLSHFFQDSTASAAWSYDSFLCPHRPSSDPHWSGLLWNDLWPAAPFLITAQTVTLLLTSWHWCLMEILYDLVCFLRLDQAWIWYAFDVIIWKNGGDTFGCTLKLAGESRDSLARLLLQICFRHLIQLTDLQRHCRRNQLMLTDLSWSSGVSHGHFKGLTAKSCSDTLRWICLKCLSVCARNWTAWEEVPRWRLSG